MKLIEEKYDDLLQRPLDHSELTKGGSIISSIWSGVKSIFGKLASNPALKTIANKTFQSATKAVEGALPTLTENAVNRLSSHLSKKLKGDEPDLTKKDLDKMREEVQKADDEAEMKAVYAQHKKKKAIVVKKGKKKALPVVEEEDEVPDEEEEDEELDAADPEEGTTRRKSILSSRKAVVPAPKQPKAHIVSYINGEPVYGYGKKKGGAWNIKLTRN
jgi:preprotein translocase subunit SecD